MLAEISPWIAGGAAGYLWGSRERSENESTMLSIGVGSYLGILACAGILRCGIHFGFNSLDNLHYYAWMSAAFALTSSAILHRLNLIKSYNLQACETQSTLFFVLFIIVITCIAMSFASLTLPTSAWDVLQGGEWRVPSFGERAIDFIQRSIGFIDSQYHYDYRHPMTNFLLLAWGAQSESIFWGSGSQALWLCMLLSVSLIVGGYSYCVHQNRVVSLLIVWLIITIPLLGNHAMLAGYNEILLALSFISTIVFTSLALESRSYLYIVPGFIFWLSLLATKSIGIAYFILTFIAISLAVISKLNRRGLLIFVSIAIVWSVLLLFYGFEVRLLNSQISWSPGDQIISFAGRTANLQPMSALAIASNFFHSTILNGSFFLTSLGFFLVCLNLWKLRLFTKTSVLFIFYLYLLIVTFLILIQFTAYGSLTSAPVSDTLFSRIAIPVHLLVFLLLPFLIGELHPPQQATEHKSSQTHEDVVIGEL